MSQHNTNHSKVNAEKASGEIRDEVRHAVILYAIGLGIAAILTFIAFWLVSSDQIWKESRHVWLAVLAVAQIGVHVVFFLHLSTSRDNKDNLIAVLFGVLIVFLFGVGTLFIMYNLNSNMRLAMPSKYMIGNVFADTELSEHVPLGKKSHRYNFTVLNEPNRPVSFAFIAFKDSLIINGNTAFFKEMMDSTMVEIKDDESNLIFEHLIVKDDEEMMVANLDRKGGQYIYKDEINLELRKKYFVDIKVNEKVRAFDSLFFEIGESNPVIDMRNE